MTDLVMHESLAKYQTVVNAVYAFISTVEEFPQEHIKRYGIYSNVQYSSKVVMLGRRCGDHNKQFDVWLSIQLGH